MSINLNNSNIFPQQYQPQNAKEEALAKVMENLRDFLGKRLEYDGNEVSATDEGRDELEAIKEDDQLLGGFTQSELLAYQMRTFWLEFKPNDQGFLRLVPIKEAADIKDSNVLKHIKEMASEQNASLLTKNVKSIEEIYTDSTI